MAVASALLQKIPILVIPIQPDSKIRYKSVTREEPRLLQKWTDPFWKHFASFWMTRARDIYREQMEIATADDTTVSLDDWTAIETRFAEIEESTKLYNEAVTSDDRESAHSNAMSIRGLVIHFNQLRTDSNARASKRLGVKKRLKGFRTLSRKRKQENSLQYALRNIHTCNKAAQKKTFERITSWVGNPRKERSIFWLHGESGCGKTVMTHCFAQACADGHVLSASYSFEVTPTTPSGSSHIETFVTNLIADIGDHLGESFQCLLGDIATPYIGKNDELLDDFLTKPFAQQINMTLIPAWERLRDADRKPLIVVLDGIDRIHYSAQTYFLSFVKLMVEKLPILLFVSSNNDKMIAYHMEDGILAGWVEKNELPKYDPKYWLCEPTSPMGSDFSEIPLSDGHDWVDDEPTPKKSHFTFSGLGDEGTLPSGSRDGLLL